MTNDSGQVMEKIKELAIKCRLKISLYMKGDTVDLSGILNRLHELGVISDEESTELHKAINL